MAKRSQRRLLLDYDSDEMPFVQVTSTIYDQLRRGGLWLSGDISAIRRVVPAFEIEVIPNGYALNVPGYFQIDGVVQLDGDAALVIT